MSSTLAISAEGERPVQAAAKPDSLTGFWRVWLAALFCLPMAVPYHWLPDTSFFANWAAVALGVIGLCVASFRRFRGGDTALAVSPIGVALLGFTIVLVVQQLLGMLPYVEQFVLPVGVLIVAACVVSISSASLSGRLDAVSVTIAWAMVIGAVLQSAWSVVQLTGFDLVGWQLVRAADGISRVGGLVAQSNNLAACLVWSLGALCFLATTGRVGRTPTLVLAIVFLFVLSFAGSRSTYVYLFVLGPALAWMLYRAPDRPARWWWPLVAPLAFVAIDVANRYLVVGLLPAVGSLRTVEVGSLDLRFGLIADAWQLFRAHPLLGVGIGNFAGSRFALASPALVELNNDHAHNIISDLTAELGLAGMLIFIAICALWLRDARSAPRSKAHAFLLVSLALLGLYSFVEFPLWLPYFLLPAAVLVGVTAPVTWRLRISRGLSRTLAGVALLLAVLVLAIAADYVRIDRAYARFFATGDASVPKSSEWLSLSSRTLFRLEADELYARSSLRDPFALEIDAAVSERVFSVNPAPEFAYVRAVHLVMLDQPDQAAAIVRRTCAWEIAACNGLRSDFTDLAARNPDLYAGFMKAAFPTRATR